MSQRPDLVPTETLRHRTSGVMRALMERLAKALVCTLAGGPVRGTVFMPWAFSPSSLSSFPWLKTFPLGQ